MPRNGHVKATRALALHHARENCAARFWLKAPETLMFFPSERFALVDAVRATFVHDGQRVPGMTRRQKGAEVKAVQEVAGRARELAAVSGVRLDPWSSERGLFGAEYFETGSLFVPPEAKELLTKVRDYSGCHLEQLDLITIETTVGPEPVFGTGAFGLLAGAASRGLPLPQRDHVLSRV